jgi:hypothetical protein
VVVAAALSALAVAALVSEVSRDDQTAAFAAPAVPQEVVKLPNDRTSENDVVPPVAQVLRYSPRGSVSGTCGRVAETAVIATECDDPRAEVVMANVSSVGSHQGTVCGAETSVVTKLGDRVTCWRDLPRA